MRSADTINNNRSYMENREEHKGICKVAQRICLESHNNKAERFLKLLESHSWNFAVRLLKAETAAQLEAKELRKVS